MKTVVQRVPFWGGAERHPGRHRLAADPHATVMAPFRPAALVTSLVISPMVVPQIVASSVLTIFAMIVPTGIRLVAATIVLAVAVTPVITPRTRLIVSILVLALAMIAVGALGICGRAGAECRCHERCCRDDLCNLHLSSPEARISGLGPIYAPILASFLNGVVGLRTASLARDTLAL